MRKEGPWNHAGIRRKAKSNKAGPTCMVQKIAKQKLFRLCYFTCPIPPHTCRMGMAFTSFHRCVLCPFLCWVMKIPVSCHELYNKGTESGVRLRICRASFCWVCAQWTDEAFLLYFPKRKGKHDLSWHGVASISNFCVACWAWVFGKQTILSENPLIGWISNKHAKYHSRNWDTVLRILWLKACSDKAGPTCKSSPTPDTDQEFATLLEWIRSNRFKPHAPRSEWERHLLLSLLLLSS